MNREDFSFKLVQGVPFQNGYESSSYHLIKQLSQNLPVRVRRESSGLYATPISKSLLSSLFPPYVQMLQNLTSESAGISRTLLVFNAVYRGTRTFPLFFTVSDASGSGTMNFSFLDQNCYGSVSVHQLQIINDLCKKRCREEGSIRFYSRCAHEFLGSCADSKKC